MFSEYMDTFIGKITTFNRSNEELLQWPSFEQFLLNNDGLPLRFVALYKQIATPFVVIVYTTPGPDGIVIEDVEDQSSP